VTIIALAVLLLWSGPGEAQSDSTEIPKHLRLARELVQNIKPENNIYARGGDFVSFPGDLLSNKHAVRADCSGFLLAIFDRAKYPTPSQMAFVPGHPLKRRTRPASEDFVYSIESEKGFRRIRHVKDIKPGDLLAHALLDLEDKRQLGSTGHVFLIDSHARRITPVSPVVPGTEQFAIAVIDSNEEWTGPDDTRTVDPSNKIKGLGRGTIRLYADENGELVGWARTFKNTKWFFSYDPRFPSETRSRKAAIGRPVAGDAGR
jgi:hypothetical protein